MFKHATRDIRANKAIHDKWHRHQATHERPPSHSSNIRDDDLCQQLQAGIADGVDDNSGRDSIDVISRGDNDIADHVEAKHDKVARRT